MNENENIEGQKDWRGERDDELFPICNEERNGDLYTDEYGQTYFCTLIAGLGWSWQNLRDTTDYNTEPEERE